MRCIPFVGVYASRRPVYGQRTWSQDSKPSVVWCSREGINLLRGPSEESSLIKMLVKVGLISSKWSCGGDPPLRLHIITSCVIYKF